MRAIHAISAKQQSPRRKKNKLLPTECFESDTLYAGAGAGASAATAPTHS